MSYNGSGTFLINTAGQPVVSGTVISSTAFNALTADLATGLSTAITKDGQTTITANIPMANYKFTGLGVGSAAGDSANLSQVQSTAVKLLASVSGADTITAVGSPNVAAYVAGQMFYFVAAGANTGAVTINIDSLGAKSITRDGTTALAAGDIQSGEVCVIVYDGTQFQLVNGASQSASIVTENLTVNKATVLNESGGDNDTRIEGDTDANLFFVDASTDRIGVGTNSPLGRLDVVVASDRCRIRNSGGGEAVLLFQNSDTGTVDNGLYVGIASNEIGYLWNYENQPLVFGTANTERMRLDASGNLGVGTTSPAVRLHLENGGTSATNTLLISSFAGSTNAFLGYTSNGSTHTGGIFGVGNNLPALFYTSNSERARITSGGDLLVGTTNTSATAGEGIKLKPAEGGAGIPSLFVVTSGSNGANVPLAIYSTGAAAYRFYVQDGGTVFATNTTISAISDQRLKENVRDLDVGLDAILALKPRKFDWKEGKGKDIKDDRGFIAQEFEQVFPDLVDEWRDPAPEGEEPYKSVRQDLIPVLVKAIQELSAKNDALEARIAALEAK